MRKRLKQVVSLILAVVMTAVVPVSSVMASAAQGQAEETTVEKATIWVVGDSTVSAFNDNYYYPRYGWGTQLDKFFDQSKFEIKNIALSGRSSKSFVLDPEYQQLTQGMKQGDYLFIGFGHNDEKAEEGRFTSPVGDYNTQGSFANSLYENYIKPAKEAGCTPVLMTPIVRRSATDNYTGTYVHITTDGKDANGNVAYPGGDYPKVIRDLGATLAIPVVDLTKMTKELYTSLGAAQTLKFHAWTSDESTSVDNTHTNIWGATYNDYFIAKTIKSLGVKGLADAVLDAAVASAPAESTLVPNAAYVKPVYDNNLEQSKLWSDYGIFKGTVFGDLGGADNLTKENFTVGTDAGGNMNIAVRNGKGKIAASTDGMAMYYYKVPSDKEFALSATATVNSLDQNNNQVSFGLMARDDMYIDVYNNATLGDYVAAGPINLKKGAWRCFARKSGVLTSGGAAEHTIEVGKPIELKIESNSDGYACTFGEELTVTGGFDFKLTKVDSKYVYVGMYAVRNADITYSNIKLIVDGKEVTAVKEPEEKPVTVGDIRNMKVLGASTNSISVGWSKVEDAAGYEVSYVNGNVSKHAVVSNPSFTEKGLKPGESRTYQVRAYKIVNDTKVYGEKAVIKTAARPDRARLNVSGVTSSSFKLSWNKLSNVSGYEVQVRKQDRWVTVKKTNATALTVAKAASGTAYKYRVRGYKVVDGKTVNGAYSANLNFATKTASPKVVLKSSHKKVYVTVSKVNGASGYELCRSTKRTSGYKNVRYVKGTKTLKYTSRELKTGKTYYFKVRAYKMVNGKKVYGNYSSVKKVTVKR